MKVTTDEATGPAGGRDGQGIEVRGLSFAYPRRRPVLQDVSFAVRPGEYVCLLGPNGVGKSTLFSCMMGLTRRFSGDVRICGDSVGRLSAREVARRVAFIPQSASHVFNYSVMDVVLMGTSALTGGLRSPGADERARAMGSLATLGMEGMAELMFLDLSGGERQLVLIARALAQSARILLMDEPTASLDFGNQARVLEHVHRLAREGYAVIQSSHNPEQAFLYADKVLALHDGRVAAFGPPRDVLTEGLVRRLYDIEVTMEDVHGGRVRTCFPSSVLK